MPPSEVRRRKNNKKSKQKSNSSFQGRDQSSKPNSNENSSHQNDNYENSSSSSIINNDSNNAEDDGIMSKNKRTMEPSSAALASTVEREYKRESSTSSKYYPSSQPKLQVVTSSSPSSSSSSKSFDEYAWFVVFLVALSYFIATRGGFVDQKIFNERRGVLSSLSKPYEVVASTVTLIPNTSPSSSPSSNTESDDKGEELLKSIFYILHKKVVQNDFDEKIGRNMESWQPLTLMPNRRLEVIISSPFDNDHGGDVYRTCRENDDRESKVNDETNDLGGHVEKCDDPTSYTRSPSSPPPYISHLLSTTWVHDAELGRGYLLLSDVGRSGRIWRWEVGGGPITIGRTLHMEKSGCRSGLWVRSGDYDTHDGVKGVHGSDGRNLLGGIAKNGKCPSNLFGYSIPKKPSIPRNFASSTSLSLSKSTPNAKSEIRSPFPSPSSFESTLLLYGSASLVVELTRGADRSSEGKNLIVAEWGERRIVRVEGESGARTPLVTLVPFPTKVPFLISPSLMTDESKERKHEMNTENNYDEEVKKEREEDEITAEINRETNEDDVPREKEQHMNDNQSQGEDKEHEKDWLQEIKSKTKAQQVGKRRLHQPNHLTYTPFGDLLFSDTFPVSSFSANDIEDNNILSTVYRLKEAVHIPPIDVELSREAHGWMGTTANSTSSSDSHHEDEGPDDMVDILFESRGWIEGMALANGSRSNDDGDNESIFSSLYVLVVIPTSHDSNDLDQGWKKKVYKISLDKYDENKDENEDEDEDQVEGENESTHKSKVKSPTKNTNANANEVKIFYEMNSSECATSKNSTTSSQYQSHHKSKKEKNNSYSPLGSKLILDEKETMYMIGCPSSIRILEKGDGLLVGELSLDSIAFMTKTSSQVAKAPTNNSSPSLISTSSPSNHFTSIHFGEDKYLYITTPNQLMRIKVRVDGMKLPTNMIVPSSSSLKKRQRQVDVSDAKTQRRDKRDRG